MSTNDKNKAWIDGSSVGMYGFSLNGSNYIIKENSPLTNNEAEWLALYSLILDLPSGWAGKVFSDSQLVVYQFEGIFRIKDLELKRLYDSCKQLIFQKNLQLDLVWIPRGENIFGKILEKELKKERKRRLQARKEIGR